MPWRNYWNYSSVNVIFPIAGTLGFCGILFCSAMLGVSARFEDGEGRSRTNRDELEAVEFETGDGFRSELKLGPECSRAGLVLLPARVLSAD